MPLVDVTIYYLETLAHARRSIAAPKSGLSAIHARHPTVANYRFLYNGVGKDYHWYSRERLAEVELAAVIQPPLNEVHELDRRNNDEIELVQFGLMVDFMGRGLGKYFLQCTIDSAWSYP